jgi:hypothetical protein
MMYQVSSGLARSGGCDLEGAAAMDETWLIGCSRPRETSQLQNPHAFTADRRPERGTEPGIHGHEILAPAASFIISCLAFNNRARVDSLCVCVTSWLR